MRGLKSTAGKVGIGLALASFVLLWGGMTWAALFPESWPLNGDDKPGELTTLQPAGPNSQSIQDLVTPVFAIAGVVFVAVMAIVFVVGMRYREDPDDPEMPKQVHGNTAWEIGWTIAPALILAVVSVLTVFTIIDLTKDHDDALQVEVAGSQWWWAFRYDLDGEVGPNGERSYTDPGDIETATELVIPVGKPVRVNIVSTDVVHSFWIPHLNGKKDAMPGMTTHWNLEASRPGVFRGQCTEFCGLSHANMRMLVRAVPQDEWDAWVENQRQPAVEPTSELAQEGKAQFESLCAQCHLIDGVNSREDLEETPPPLVSGVAPNLTHLMSRGTFAGSIYNLYYPNPIELQDQPSGATCTMDDLENCGDPADVSLAGNPDNPVYRPALEAWLRDPPAMKPMDADAGRGMPNLELSEDQIDALVAYLEVLK